MCWMSRFQMKGALQTKTGMESVGLTPSDDLFMRDDGRRFGDGMSRISRVWQYNEYIWLFCRSPGNLKPTTCFNRAL